MRHLRHKQAREQCNVSNTAPPVSCISTFDPSKNVIGDQDPRKIFVIQGHKKRQKQEPFLQTGRSKMRQTRRQSGDAADMGAAHVQTTRTGPLVPTLKGGATLVPSMVTAHGTFLRLRPKPHGTDPPTVTPIYRHAVNTYFLQAAFKLLVFIEPLFWHMEAQTSL